MGRPFLCCAAVIVLLAGPAAYAGPAISDIEVQPELQYQFGNAEWQSSFISGIAPNGMIERTVSVLRFNDLNVLAPAILVGFTLYDILRINAAFQPAFVAWGPLRGNGTDTDLIRLDGFDSVFSRSTFDVDDRPTSVMLTADLHLSRFVTSRSSGTVSAVFGYLYDSEDMTMTNGLQVISADPNTPAVGTRFPDLNATYRFEWNAVMLGARLRLLRRGGLRIDSSLGFLQAFYSGEGFWNLRTFTVAPNPFAWRSTSPNFMHSDATGYGFSFGFSAGMDVMPGGTLSLGYRFLSLYASDGIEKIFFNDPTLSSQGLSLDHALLFKNIISLAYIMHF